jgi:succinyl-diaminopimelate desuccinylase
MGHSRLKRDISGPFSQEEMNAKELMRAVANDEAEMVESLRAMLRVKAIGPAYGGDGESDRAAYLLKLLSRLGLSSVEMFESPDPNVSSGKRPNIVVRQRGSSSKNIWIVTHTDTVPEGDIGAWKYPPYDPQVVDGKIFGRGAEDNGQELMASLFALRALVKNGITPELNVGLVFVADEEHGNVHGIEFLLKKGMFKKGDLVIAPDHGQGDGAAIAVVEKGIAWINVEVTGRQTHASTPDKGINAFEAASRFVVAAVDGLRKQFHKMDPLFDPPASTFEPTKCDSNGPNVNTVPGRQQFAFDFRVLPDYRLDEIMSFLRRIADECERSTGAKIQVTFISRSDPAPKTREDSEIVVRLSEAIETVRGVKPRVFGIGGGTCATPFRREGIEAAVWSTIPETAHDANEHINISDLVADAQVYAVLFAGRSLG